MKQFTQHGFIPPKLCCVVSQTRYWILSWPEVCAVRAGEPCAWSGEPALPWAPPLQTWPGSGCGAQSARAQPPDAAPDHGSPCAEISFRAGCLTCANMSFRAGGSPARQAGGGGAWTRCILGCQQSFSLLKPLCCVPWRNSLDTSNQNNRDPSLPCDCVVRLLIVLFVLMKRHTQCGKCFRKREGLRSEIRRKKT